MFPEFTPPCPRTKGIVSRSSSNRQHFKAYIAIQFVPSDCAICPPASFQSCCLAKCPGVVGVLESKYRVSFLSKTTLLFNLCQAPPQEEIQQKPGPAPQYSPVSEKSCKANGNGMPDPQAAYHGPHLSGIEITSALNKCDPLLIPPSVFLLAVPVARCHPSASL